MPKKLAVGASTINVIFPLGMAYVSASLKQAGYRVFTANLDFIEGDTAQILNAMMREHAIDVVCTGGLSLDVHKIKEVIDIARAIDPEITTVVGGGIISSDPEVAMRVLGADIGVIGEGEITICELAHTLDNGLGLQDVAGLIYKTSTGELHTTPARPEIQDIDTIPFPDLEGFGYGHFVRSTGGSGMVLSDRSCPMSCTFCFNPTGRTFRQRSFDNLFAEIDFQIKTYQLKSIGFTSELFAIKKQRLYEFCERIKGYGISWACNLRVRDVDADVLKVMSDAGCREICYGLESADNTVLKSMRKAITVDHIEHALEVSYQANIGTPASNFIFGDVAETVETAENTLNFWRKYNKKMHINLTMIQTYPGTHLYNVACEKGIITDRERFLLEECPVVNVSRMSDLEFHSLRSRINELQLEPHIPASAVRLLEIQQNGDCRAEFTCRRCGEKTEIDQFFWYKIMYGCNGCGTQNEVDTFECATHVQDAFFAAAPAGQTVALWGAGGVFYKLAREYPRLTTQDFVLLDANKSQQGFSMRGMEIHAPSVIAVRNIDSVIITALSRTDSIIATIQSEYPGVKTILSPALQIDGTKVIPVLKVHHGQGC